MDANNPVVLIGFGGHAVSVVSALQSSGKQIAGYVDVQPHHANPFELTYLGNDSQYLNNPLLQALHFCTLGDNAMREKLQNRYTNKGLNFTNVIHPTAFIEPTAKLGVGVFVGAMCYINGLAQIGHGTILNNHVNVDHECVIGRFAHLSPGTCLAGNVTIGERSFLGCGSCVIPGISIENDAITGAGSVVIRNVKTGDTVYGNPAKPKRK